MTSVVSETHAAVLLMLEEERHAREGLAARLARVALHVRMCLEVSAQVRAVGKRAGTVWTNERLLARMRAHVT